MCTIAQQHKSAPTKVKSKSVTIKYKKPMPVNNAYESLQESMRIDIDESRKRRTELYNDVNELIKISKFFQKHYTDDFLILNNKNNSKNTPRKSEQKTVTEQKIPTTKTKTIGGKRETAAGKQNWSCVTTKEIDKKQIINGRSKIVTEVKTNAVKNHANGNVAHDEQPPLFNKTGLSVYYSNVVDEFFENNIRANRSSPQRKIITVNAANVKLPERNHLNAKKRNDTNRSRSASGGRPCRSNGNDEVVKVLSARGSLMNDRSRAIMAKTVKSGANIKKHSCASTESIHKTSSRSPPRKRLTSSRNIRHYHSFQQSHPNIELIETNSVFPKRVIKQSTSVTSNGLPQNQRASIAKTESQTAQTVLGERYAKDSWHDVLSSRSNASMIPEVNTEENTHQESPVKTNNRVLIAKAGPETKELSSHMEPEIASPYQVQKMPTISIKSAKPLEIQRACVINIEPITERRNIKEKSENKNTKLLEFVYEEPKKVQVDQFLTSNSASGGILETGESKIVKSRSTFKFKQHLRPGVKPHALAVEEEEEEEEEEDDALDSSLADSVSIHLPSSPQSTDDERNPEPQVNQRLPPHRNKQVEEAYQSFTSKLNRRVIARDLIEEALQHGNDDKNPIDLSQAQNLSSVFSSKPIEQVNDDILELREILEKIKLDKTSLDIAMETNGNKEKTENLITPTSSNLNTVRAPFVSNVSFQDTEAQCENVLGTFEKKATVRLNRLKDHPATKCYDNNYCNGVCNLEGQQQCSKNTSQTSTISYDDHTIIHNSPKFKRTLNSIRSSARRLEYKRNADKYATATPEQIKKAAETFLKSVKRKKHRIRLFHSDSVIDDVSTSFDHSSQLLPKYKVIDDQIIQSRFSNTNLLTLDLDSSISGFEETGKSENPKATHYAQSVTSGGDGDAAHLVTSGGTSGSDIDTSTSTIEYHLSKLRVFETNTSNTSLQSEPMRRMLYGGNSIDEIMSNRHKYTDVYLSEGEVLSEGEIRENNCNRNKK